MVLSHSTNDTPLLQPARGAWSDDEHERFLEGLRLFPNGPWKAIAERVGTRTVRQVQTHAQVYQERAARRLRELRSDHARRSQSIHEVEREMKEICETLQQSLVPLSPRSTALQRRSVDQVIQASRIYCAEHSTSPHVDKAHACGDGLSDVHAMPSFDECIDYLIEVFGSADQNEA